MIMYEDFKNGKNVVYSFNEKNEYVQHELNHMISGDTDSCYMKLPNSLTEGLEVGEIVTICDEIGKLANDTFSGYVQRVFNCPDERKDTIQTDREVVSDKSFFLSKKRYIMHVIDMEGIPCDKMKIAGVEIKKANTSNMTKKFLMELVNMILDGHTIHEVKNRINQMKEEFMQSDIKDIATTMNAKGIKHATDTYNLTGSMKGIHYASKAALVYNLRCTNMDRKVVPGDKVSIYYTLGKESAIAFPSDLNTLPDWLLEIPVDYDKMWSKCHKTITNYLKAMDWDIESRKEAIGLELFGLEKVEKTKRRKK